MNWTYADGIYVSGGSQNVVVKNCLVQNTGDDGTPLTCPSLLSFFSLLFLSLLGISCVSYLGSSNVNITYANNNVQFVRQGRGMTIIGGKNVLFQENTITDCVSLCVLLLLSLSLLLSNLLPPSLFSPYPFSVDYFFDHE